MVLILHFAFGDNNYWYYIICVCVAMMVIVYLVALVDVITEWVWRDDK